MILRVPSLTLPEGIEFTESSADDDSQKKELAKDDQQRSDAGEAETDSNHVVVVSPTTEVMNAKTVLGTKKIGDVLKISRKQGEWWLVEWL